MRVAKNTFLISVSSDRNADIGITGANGKKIIIDTDYNKYSHTMRMGQIYACPIGISEEFQYDTTLSDGDTVLFHHFICQPNHKTSFGENIYWAEYLHLYAKLEDKIVKPLEDIIFVEPILEDEEKMYAGNIRVKAHRENIKQQGIVFAASKKATAAGILPGDKVFFSLNADYKMKVGEEDLYRMRIRNIGAIERNGELICLHDRILVKNENSENRTGEFIDARVSTQKTGIVMLVGKNCSGVIPGEKVSYFRSAVGDLQYKGEVYAMLEERNINYIIE